MKLNYEFIINSICESNDISREEIEKICKDKDLKYISILLLKKYGCMELDKISEDFSIKTKRNLKYNENRAQEKLLVNYNFREKYFSADEIIKENKAVKKVR